MRKVIVNEWMSLDGVVQAPGAPDEDTTGGFKHGGWHMRYFDELSQQKVLEGFAETGGFLLGRRTYEIFAAYWPNAPEEEQVVAEPHLPRGRCAQIAAARRQPGDEYGRDPRHLRSGRRLIPRG
jgi:dihydrofolate reductase